MQDNIEQPKEGEFPTPESAVHYFLEQARNHNRQAVLRVFPVMESYKYNDFAFLAKRLNAIILWNGPRPYQPLHNLLWSTQQAFFTYDKITYYLLFEGDTIYLKTTPLNDDEKKLDYFLQKLEPANLTQLKIVAISTHDEYNFMKRKSFQQLGQKLGFSKMKEVRYVLHLKGRKYQGSFATAKFGSNWKIYMIMDEIETVKLMK
jgi:hypothetical protein